MIELLPFEKRKSRIIIKKEIESSPKYGCKPENRTIKEMINYGIVNVDKPPGPTSHQVSEFVQKILKINKSGHSGTLDPKVTGVLPVALGRATKVTHALLKAGKEYITLMHVHGDYSKEEIKKVCGEFVGKIKQIPPLRSAVKRRERERKIYYLNIMEINEREVLFKVGCEAGTYIRKLAHDIGIRLGSNAHMAELRRTKAAGFDEKTLVMLQDLKDAFYYYKQGNEKFLRKLILPVEDGVKHLKKIWVIDSSVESLCHGVNLKMSGIAKYEDTIEKDETIAVMTLKDELICLAKAKLGHKELAKDKGVAASVERVFMEAGTYPKIK